MSNTEREKYHFKVKEYDATNTWIMMEPHDIKKELSILRRGFLGFELKPGIDEKKAHEIASVMNQYIDGVTYTSS